MIADAEPHPPSYTTADIFWQEELEVYLYIYIYNDKDILCVEY